jgi:DNA-binding CsgD family transcriptional regulator
MAGTPLDLSPRERELILAVARGHSSVQIAALQQVRSDSIRRSLSALYRKVGVRNQRGLVAWGLEQGLLRPPDLHAPLRPPELAARGNGHRSLAGDR